MSGADPIIYERVAWTGVDVFDRLPILKEQAGEVEYGGTL